MEAGIGGWYRGIWSGRAARDEGGEGRRTESVVVHCLLSSMVGARRGERRGEGRGAEEKVG